jgi:tRNA threonylcarbamoyladenosine biosynthesis protein TsaB
VRGAAPTAAGRGLLLALDTSGEGSGLVLAGEGFVDVALLPLTAGGQARTEDLSTCVADLLGTRGLGPGDLRMLGAVVGPGSYTGLRSGLAFLVGLSLADSLPSVAVGSLELLAWRTAREKETAAACRSAGAGRAMVAAYRREGEVLVEVSAPVLVEGGGGGAWAVSAAVLASTPDLPVEVVSAATAAGLEVRAPEGDALVALAHLVRAKAGRGLAGRASSLLPVYVGQSTARPNRHRVALPELPE